MKIETKILEDHQAEIISEVEGDVFGKLKQAAARQITKERAIPGFRPGKAPYNIVQRLFGDDFIEEQAISLYLDREYSKVLDEAGVNPYGPGKLDKVISKDPLTLQFTVPLEPEVTLPDLYTIQQEYAYEPPSDDEINHELRKLQVNFATAEPAERPVQKGDLIFVKIEGIDPEAAADTEPPLKSNELQFIVGEEESYGEVDFPFKGFSASLIGLEKDQEQTVDHIMEDDNPLDASLAGKTIRFNYSVRNVKSLTLPELDDDFAQTLGRYENFDSLKEAVKDRIDEQKSSAYKTQYFNRLLDTIAEKSTIKYPPQMVEDEKESTLESFKQNIARRNLDLETYLKMEQMDNDKFIAEVLMPVVMNKIRRNLVIKEVIKQEKIQVKGEEVESAFQTAITEMSRTMDMKQLLKKSSASRFVESLTMQVHSELVTDRVFTRLQEIATQAKSAESVESAPEIASETTANE